MISWSTSSHPHCTRGHCCQPLTKLEEWQSTLQASPSKSNRFHSHLPFASRLTWIHLGSDIVVSVMSWGSFSGVPFLLAGLSVPTETRCWVPVFSLICTRARCMYALLYNTSLLVLYSLSLWLWCGWILKLRSLREERHRFSYEDDQSLLYQQKCNWVQHRFLWIP